MGGFFLIKYNMPSTVFPAPGCANGVQHLYPFSAFDIAPVRGKTFKNLLVNSSNFLTSNWIRNVDGVNVLGNYDYDTATWTTFENQLFPNSGLNIDPSLNNLAFLITIGSTSQYLGQEVTVQPNTEYTFSFYCRRGTSTDLKYRLYDVTNQQNIVSPTSYYSSTNIGYFSRISVTFTTPSSCQTVRADLLADSAQGNVEIALTQFELGNSATNYDATVDISFAALGAPAQPQEQNQFTSSLGFFIEYGLDLSPVLSIVGQSVVQYQSANYYTFESEPFFPNISSNTEKIIYFTTQVEIPYKTGTFVNIFNNFGFRNTYLVIRGTVNSVTINSEVDIPRDSAIAASSFSVYEKSLVFTLTQQWTGLSSTSPRQALFIAENTPNLRGLKYFIDREFTVNDTRQSGLTNPINNIRGITDEFIRTQVPKILPRSNISDLQSEIYKLPVTNISSSTTQASAFASVFQNSNSRNTTYSSLQRAILNDKTAFYLTSVFSLIPFNNVVSDTSNENLSRSNYLNKPINSLKTLDNISLSFAENPKLVIKAESNRLEISKEDKVIFKNNIVLEKQDSYRLETFDNIGLTSTPIYSVSGVDSGTSANTVSYYLDDLFLTTSQRPITSLRIFFNNSDSFVKPYAVGSYVSLSRELQEPLFSSPLVSQVRDCDSVSVTIDLPNDWDINTRFTTISSASVPVVSMNDYRPTSTPTSARDFYYYTTLANGYKSRNLNVLPNLYSSEPIIESGNLTQQLITLKSDTFNLSVNKLSASTVVRSPRSDSQFASLNKPIVNLKTVSQNDPYGKLSSAIIVKNTVDIKDQYNIEKFRVDRTQVFYTGDFGKANSISVLKTIDNNLKNDEFLTQFKVRSQDTSVFSLPIVVDKLSSAIVVKEGTNIVRVGSLKASSVVKSVRSEFNTALLQKPLVRLVDDYRLSNIVNMTSYQSQNDVRVNTNPQTPAERFYYFNLAPGYKFNQTIQRGRLFAPDNNRINNYSIDSFTPQSLVRPTTSPASPGEFLYYANLAPGYKFNKSIQLGLSFTDIRQDTGVQFVNDLASAIVVKTDRILLNVESLTKPIVDLTTTPYSMLDGKLLIEQTTLREINSGDSLILSDLAKFGKDINLFVEYNPQMDGFILKFKTGDFKTGSGGIFDAAAVKKPPITFWN